MIDSLREQIHHRLEQLAEEGNRLRHALAALDPRSTPTSTPDAPARKPATAKPSSRAAAPATRIARTAPRAAGAKPKEAAAKSAPARRARKPAAQSPGRTASGATRAVVIGALGDEPLTAGQVAEKTGLARGTVSTTLSRLAKSGEVQKAERGYSLAPAAEPAPVAPAE